MEVHQAGGGINFTVEKTREASEDQLLELLMSRLARMLRAGKDEKRGLFFPRAQSKLCYCNWASQSHTV